MSRKQPPWEAPSGVQFLRLYKKDPNDNWPTAVNKDDLHPGFPEIVVWDLTADQYTEFSKKPEDFIKYHLGYTGKITVAKPRCIPPKKKSRSVSYTVVTVHTHTCTYTVAGGEQS